MPSFHDVVYRAKPSGRSASERVPRDRARPDRGFATDQVDRSIEHAYPDARLQPGKAAHKPPYRPAPRPRRMTAPKQPAPPAATVATDKHDPAVKPAANWEESLIPSPEVVPPPAAIYPIDLTTALRLADVANPTIAAARTMIIEALALRTSARVLLFPSLNAGGSYSGHNGNLQRSAGTVLNLSKQAIFLGAGAGVTSAETIAIPGILTYSPLTNAWFEPLAAHQRVIGARFARRRPRTISCWTWPCCTSTCLATRPSLMPNAFRKPSTRRLSGSRVSSSRPAKGARPTPIGPWPNGDASTLVQKAEGEVGVAAARLANRLNLDPAVRLHPVGGELVPLGLIPLDSSPSELIHAALRQRPDLGAQDREHR